MIWRPDTRRYSHSNLLTMAEIRSIVEGFIAQGVTPFIFTVEPPDRHGVYHLPLQTPAERRLADHISRIEGLTCGTPPCRWIIRANSSARRLSKAATCNPPKSVVLPLIIPCYLASKGRGSGAVRAVGPFSSSQER